MEQHLYGTLACTALAAAFLLSGCGQTTDTTSSSHDSNFDPSTPQAQIKLIVDSKALWFQSQDYANELFAYTVTDLDRNGRLELIVANMGGTGLYTYSSFYEVNETFDALESCAYNAIEGDSQADIIIDTAPVYIDTETGSRYYVFDDLIRNGAAEYYENKRALSLEKGQINTLPLAWKTSIYTEGNSEPEVTCIDQNQVPISETDYDAIANTAFEGLEQKTAHFGWYEVWGSALEDAEALDADAWLEILHTSYDAFSLS